jgi:8-oxo-dGTP diphosphatase
MRRIDVVCGVIYNSNNQLLIAQRGDLNNYGKWEFPGGKVQSDEPIPDSIKREILEELSIEILVKEKVFENEIEIDGTIYNLIFLSCLYKSGDILLKEHLNYEWIENNQLDDYDFLEGDFEFINQLKNDNIKR